MKKKILGVFSAVALAGLAWMASFSGVKADDTINSAVNYLSSQAPDQWITMALLVAGKTDTDLSYLKTDNCPSSSDVAACYEKTILVLTAAGNDPKTFGDVDLVAKLKGFYQNNQISSSLNDDFWGILALSSAGENQNGEIIQGLQNFILTNQNSDGGWSYAAGSGSDIDDTAAAIMALLESGTAPDNSAVAKAIDYLKSKQNNDGGFPYDVDFSTASDASSDAWVISAIYKLGQNLSDWSKSGNSPVDNLRALQKPDGSFDSNFPDSAAWAVIALSQKFYPINNYSSASSPASGGVGVPYCNIEVSAGTGGSVSSDRLTNNVACGTNLIYSIVPSTGYQVADVLVDGISAWAVTSYTFNRITADHTISATFSAIVPPPQVEKPADVTAAVQAPQPADAVTASESVQDQLNDIQAKLNVISQQVEVLVEEQNRINRVASADVSENLAEQSQKIIPEQKETVLATTAPEKTADLSASVTGSSLFGGIKLFLMLLALILIVAAMIVFYFIRRGKVKI